MYSSASSYRFRPLGPEETLMEIWSLTRVAEGEEPPTPKVPSSGERRQALAADPSAGLRQPAASAEGPARVGLRVHAALELGEGTSRTSIAHRRLPRRPAPQELRKAVEALNVNPLEQPIVDLGI